MSALRVRVAPPAVSEQDRIWSVEEVAALCDAFAEGEGLVDPPSADQHAEHLPPVAVVGGSSLATLVGLFALLRAGRVVAPLHVRLTTAERRRALAELGVERVYSEEVLERALRSAQSVVERQMGRSAEVEAVGQAASKRDAVVLWTSGTSGTPRGVVLTHANLAASGDAVSERLSLGATDRWYAALSPAHVGGLALLHRAGQIGATVVAVPRFDAEDLAARIAEGKVTHASLVPTMLDRLLDAWGPAPIPPSFKVALIGGAACPPDLLTRALDVGLPVALTYGMSEATSQVTTATPDEVVRKRGSVGRPLSDIEVRIVGGSTGRIGEIQVRGPTVAPRFWSGEQVADRDGWYRTGDLGEVDDAGDLWIRGRSADRIITGGVNVDPLEVEAVLRAAPGVRDAAVFGVPDREWGEVLCAAIVFGASGATVESIRSHLKRELSAPKIPKRFTRLTEIPTNANGKVDRAAVRATFLAEDEFPS